MFPLVGAIMVMGLGEPHCWSGLLLDRNWKGVAFSRRIDPLQTWMFGAGWLVSRLLALGVQPLNSPITGRLAAAGTGRGETPAHSTRHSSVISLKMKR